MKHQTGKIKTEHHILPEFKDILKKIEALPEVKRIIPGVISRQQKGTGELILSFSYPTPSGLKYKMKKGSTAQELFILSTPQNEEKVKAEIQEITKTK